MVFKAAALSIGCVQLFLLAGSFVYVIVAGKFSQGAGFLKLEFASVGCMLANLVLISQWRMQLPRVAAYVEGLGRSGCLVSSSFAL